MKKKVFLGILLVVVICFCVFSLLNCCVEQQEKKIDSLEKQILSLKSDVSFVQFLVKDRNTRSGSESITVMFKIFNLDNKEIAKFEDTLKGTELFIDFQLVKISSAYLAFPFRYFSEQQAPATGKLFYSYYDEKNFPKIYSSDSAFYGLSKESLTTIFSELKKPGENVSDFGSAVHEISSISDFEVGIPYKIIYHPQKGGIEIVTGDF